MNRYEESLYSEGVWTFIKIIATVIFIGAFSLLWLINSDPFIQQLNFSDPKQLLRAAMHTPSHLSATTSWRQQVVSVDKSRFYMIRKPYDWGSFSVHLDRNIHERILFNNKDQEAARVYQQTGVLPDISPLAILKISTDAFPETYIYKTIRGPREDILSGLGNTWIFNEVSERPGYTRIGVLTDGARPGDKILFWCEAKNSDPFELSMCETLVRTLRTDQAVDEKDFEKLLN